MPKLAKPIVLDAVTDWEVTRFAVDRDAPLARGQVTIQLMPDPGSKPKPEKDVFGTYELDVFDTPRSAVANVGGIGHTETLEFDDKQKYGFKIKKKKQAIQGALSALVAAERSVTSGDRDEELAAVAAACVTLGIMFP